MKKYLGFFLLLIKINGSLDAQGRSYDLYGNAMSDPYPQGMAEQIFNYPSPGKLNVNFSFWGIGKSGKCSFELMNIRQLKYLSNPDSILKTILPALKSISDSLKTSSAFSRRIDLILNNQSVQMRIFHHDHTPREYVWKSGNLSEVKMDPDTIRIKSYVEVSEADAKNNDRHFNGSNYPRMQPYYITLTFNRYTDVFELPDFVLQKCLDKVLKELGSEYAANADTKSIYRADFNMITDKMISPGKASWIRNPGSVQELVPNIYTGLQFSKGSFVPSFAAGIRYTFANRKFSTRRIYAMWEPHFFFNKDLQNNIITERNDFLTLRYIKIEHKKKEAFDFVGNVSLGYLISRQGNWLDPNSIKMGLPGVRSGWLQLEPELFFHDFFKGISPSIRLTIHYE